MCRNNLTFPRYLTVVHRNVSDELDRYWQEVLVAYFNVNFTL